MGVKGMELILKESIRVNGDDAGDDNVGIDTIVREKNIISPAEAKLHRKIIRKCRQIA